MTVLALAAYCLSSIIMTITNKMVLSSFDFQLNFLLLAFQSLTCVVMLETFQILGLATHRPFRKKYAKKWGIVSCALVAMIYTGSKALQYLHISLFTVFKNVTIIAIAFAERRFINGPKVTGLMILSFFLIILSSVIGGWADLTTDENMSILIRLTGYAWMLLNCFASAAFSLQIARAHV